MWDRFGGRRGLLLGVVAALAVAVGFTVATTASAGRTAKCGTVTLNEQAWAGSTANTYVAKYVLEHNLGCKVNITKITEIPVYQAMADGKVDAVLEDWQHTDQYKQYVTKQKSVVLVGPNGVQGVIGWYIPDYLMKAHPEFKTWKGLKGKESLFKSPESGSQGMFLGGDPSYVQKDQRSEEHTSELQSLAYLVCRLLLEKKKKRKKKKRYYKKQKKYRYKNENENM